MAQSSKISTKCPKCDAKLSVKSENAGKQLRCPKCRGLVIIPIEEAVVPPVPPVPEFDDYDDFPTSDDYENDPYITNKSTFKSRTSNLLSDLQEELVPRNLIPTGVARLVADDEQFLFASNPSHTVMVIRLIIYGVLSIINPFILGFIIVSLRSNSQSVVSIIIALWMWISFILYLTYISWKSRYFAITSRRIIVRTGWFSHTITMAPVNNIQLVIIKTGFVDRWLGLNNIHFETAAASSFGFLRSGVLVFKNVYCDEVMKAYSVALGKQAIN